MAEANSAKKTVSRAPTWRSNLINMNKWYGEFHVLRDINLKVMKRRAHRRLPDRPVRASRP